MAYYLVDLKSGVVQHHDTVDTLNLKIQEINDNQEIPEIVNSSIRIFRGDMLFIGSEMPPIDELSRNKA